MKIEDLPQRCLLVFTSTTCTKCEELINTIKNADLDIEVIYINDENGKELGMKYTILVAPTTLLVENGKEIDRFYGSKSKEYITNFI